MDKVCVICDGIGRYKCPTCFIFYCSVTCCKIHREENCEVIIKDNNAVKTVESVKKRKVVLSDTALPEVKLNFLRNSEEIKKLLANQHLRNLLITIDNAENADEIMQKAMQEPLFVEFADSCLKVVDPENAPALDSE